MYLLPKQSSVLMEYFPKNLSLQAEAQPSMRIDNLAAVDNEAKKYQLNKNTNNVYALCEGNGEKDRQRGQDRVDRPLRGWRKRRQECGIRHCSGESKSSLLMSGQLHN